MQFPRIKEFKFDIDKTYTVPAHLTGRLHRIAHELYGDFKYYKPLAAANGIKLSHGFRVGIRPVEEALRTEIEQTETNDYQVEADFDAKIDEKRINNLDWNNYFDVSYGYMSEVTTGKVLLVPTFNSATSYLNKFEFVN